VWVSCAYGVVLLLDSQPDAFQLWVSIVMLLVGNWVIVGWIAERMREVVAEAQGARLAAEAAKVQAEAVSGHKSDFLANTSHELCTPLNAIIGFAQVLNDDLAGPLGDKQAEYVADVLESGRHLLALITDLLALAKLEAGRLPSMPTQLEVDQLVSDVTTELASLAGRRRITLSTSLSPSLPVVVGDRQNLQQALSNLVSNGIKFTRDGGRVEVIARAADGASRVLISVRDTGIGILPEQRPRLFEAFHQGTRPLPQHARGGTGLGLTLAKGLVELEGGSIGVESTPGVGSTFTVSLPVLAEVRPAAV
jgi:signal transduction histidine kinase